MVSGIWSHCLWVGSNGLTPVFNTCLLRMARMQTSKVQYSEVLSAIRRTFYFLRDLQKFFEFFDIWECLL